LIAAAYFAGQQVGKSVDTLRRLVRWESQEEVRVEVGDAAAIVALGRARFTPSRRTAYLGSPRNLLEERDGWIAELRGAFSLARLEPAKLLLARGRFGGRALFMARDLDGTFFVCSRLAPLHHLLGRTIDREALAGFLLDRPRESRAPFAGITRVGAGEVIEISRQGERRTELRALKADRLPPASVDDYAEELLRLTRRAVERAVDGSRAVGVAVGGLDSSALVALACQMRGATLKEVAALTLHFADEGDDRASVASLCGAYGLEPIRLRPAATGPRLLETLIIDATPMIRPQAAWSIELGRRAKQSGADVLLDGEWGDALFDGDLSWFADRFCEGHVLPALVGAARIRGIYWMPSRRERIRNLVLRPALHRIFNRSRYRFRRKQREELPVPWAGPELALQARRVGIPKSLGILDLARSPILLDVQGAIEQWVLASGCSMIQPYVDDDLVEFVGRLPREVMFHGGYRRGLFRHAFRELLPPAVLWREDKSSFFMALRDTIAAAGGARSLQSFADDPILAREGWVDRGAFRAAIAKLDQAPFDARHGLKLWPFIAVEAFLRTLDRAPLP
jgi:asparagine synthetase B (glutamine-hydrolysing)